MKAEHGDDRCFNTARFYKYAGENPRDDSAEVISEVRVQNSSLFFYTEAMLIENCHYVLSPMQTDQNVAFTYSMCLLSSV